MLLLGFVRWRANQGGPLISDGLSWSPMSADYLIPRPL